jgi:hypothetical protein
MLTLSTKRLRMLKNAINGRSQASKQDYGNSSPLQLSQVDELTQRAFDKPIDIPKCIEIAR